MKTLTFFWLQQYLKQGRVIIIYVLAFLLFLLNAFIYAGRYDEDLIAEGQRTRNLQETYGEVASPDALGGTAFNLALPATPLRFVVDSNLEDVPTTRYVSPHNAFLPSSASRQRQQLLGLWDIDLAFLVSVIFTFLALVLTFDSVCGEREQGTLRLLMTTGIPRYKLVLSKIAATLIALGLPLLIGLIANYLYLNFSGVISFSPEHILVILLFFVFSLLLLLFFTALGMLVSSLTRNSITSLVILLLLWVMLVVVLPGMAKPLAKEFAKTKTPEEFNKATQKIFEAMMEDFETFGALDRPAAMAIADNFKYERLWDKVSIRFNNSMQAARDEQLRDLYLQAEAARNLARVSPNMVFNLAVSRIAATDFTTVKNFHEQVARYKTVLFEFMRGEDAADKDSPHILRSDGRGYMSTKPLTAQIPPFKYRHPSLGERLSDTIMDTLILFALAMLALLGGIFSFNRYDVR